MWLHSIWFCNILIVFNGIHQHSVWKYTIKHFLFWILDSVFSFSFWWIEYKNPCIRTKIYSDKSECTCLVGSIILHENKFCFINTILDNYLHCNILSNLLPFYNQKWRTQSSQSPKIVRIFNCLTIPRPHWQNAILTHKFCVVNKFKTLIANKLHVLCIWSPALRSAHSYIFSWLVTKCMSFE